MTDEPVQLSREDLKSMSAAEISMARKSGALRKLLSGEDSQISFTVPDVEGFPQAGKTFQSYRAYIRSLTPHQIVESKEAGLLPGPDGTPMK